jgi:hypothetical protein
MVEESFENVTKTEEKEKKTKDPSVKECKRE